jgi:tetratricopeptide (TPR) repeat protein
MNSRTQITGRRLWLMRFAALIFIPLLVLGGLELVLRLAGYGYDTHFFRTVQINGKQFFAPNEKFSYRFFPPAIARKALPISFAAEKGTNSYRIFLFGESAAMGDPDPTFGFGRYLEVLLRERYPGTDFQVICVAMTAIDSSTILPIARECVRHQGDLWLIYMGNNEMVGPFGAETTYGLRSPSTTVIRMILAIKSTRVGQLLETIISHSPNHSATPKKWSGMEMFEKNRLGHDDPARLRAYVNFQRNLEDILHVAGQADVPVIMSTVAVNLKDCAPFASMHATGLNENQISDWNQIYAQGNDFESVGAYQNALDQYQKAAKIDHQFADLQFRMGSCDFALTNNDRARQEFELARDYDALDFRADTRINSAIKVAVSRHAGQNVFLLDAENLLAQGSPGKIPGSELFYEHVHLNFAGNYLLALNFGEQMGKILPDSITAHDRGNWASEEICDRRLAVTAWDRLGDWQRILSMVTLPPFTGQFNHDANLKTYMFKMSEAKLAMDMQTPEQAREIYKQALAIAPNDIFLNLNFAAFLIKAGFLTQAIAEAKRCCELVPQSPEIYYHAATLLVSAGNITEAGEYFSKALAIRNDYVEAQNEMGEILANQQKATEAANWFKRAIRVNPSYAESFLNLGFLQQNQGEHDAAMVSYQQAADLEPEGPADYFNRANIAASQYQWDAAIAFLSVAVKANPEFWQARYQLGVQLAANGKVEEAEKQFAAVNYCRPDFIPAHLDLGTALAAQGKLDRALMEFRTVLRFDPTNSAAQQQITSIKTELHHQSH